MRTGIIFDEPISAYHSSEAVSNSKLQIFRRLPLLYKLTYIDRVIAPREETKATRIGSGVDVLLLEGVDAFNDRVRVTPETYGPESKPWNWNANECKAWRTKNEQSGKLIISSDESTQIEEISQAVLRHPIAAELLEHAKPAVTFREDAGLFHLQCRTDGWNENGCRLPDGKEIGPYWVELKTAASLLSGDFYTFEDAYLNRGYWLQTALYWEIIRDIRGPNAEPVRPIFIVADKLEFPLCQVFDPLSTERGRECFELARRKVQRDLEALVKCYETGVFPGLPGGMQPLELPVWRQKELEKELG